MSKITRVVLHKHGMGCFERHAKVSGDAKLELSFRHDEMDDALKSLSVVDHGGGQLAAVSYEPHPALSERLNDIKVKLPEGGGIIDSPGMQTFGLVHLDGQDLEASFREFRPYAGQCRFRDCRHDSEPDCALRAAAESGKIEMKRLRQFLQFRTECEQGRRQAQGW